MSVPSLGAVYRLVEDLRGPAGGWTVGIVTLVGVFAVPLIDAAGAWPAPGWTATAAMFLLLFVHILWGSAGYYPRRI